MSIKKITAALFFLIVLFSCSEKKQNSGFVNADISKLTQDFDQVVVLTWGLESLGDSIITDTVEAKNGKFQYHFETKEPKITSFVLLKKRKRTAILGFKSKNPNNKIIFADIYLGNENAVISPVSEIPGHPTKRDPLKYYIVTIEGSKEADIRMGTMNGEKYTSSERIKSNPDSYAILHQLFDIKDQYSTSQLKMLSMLFSDNLKKSVSYTILQKYIAKREQLERYGYAKNFNFVDINGKSYTFEDIKKDKPKTLLIFWASWCGPCRKEIPELKQFYYKYKDKLSMVSLSVDKEYKSWKTAVDKENMPWLNLSDLPNEPNGIKEKFNISTVPNLILLDENGKVLLNGINNLPEIEKIINIR